MSDVPFHHHKRECAVPLQENRILRNFREKPVRKISAKGQWGKPMMMVMSDVPFHHHKREVEQAGFVVLKSPDVPSILVETGFLSNPEEARLLANASYQKRLASAISEGIRAYMFSKPPPDSLSAILKDGASMSHLIRRGDTLSGISQRYQISTRLLREVNGLTGDRIREGQVIVIKSTL